MSEQPDRPGEATGCGQPGQGSEWLGRVKAFISRQVRIWRLVARGHGQGHILLWAFSLAYMTLLATVPVLALAFSMLKAFGGLERANERLMPFMMENLAAGSAEKVSEYVTGVIKNVDAGGISGVSALVLFWTMTVLFSNVEKSVNEIWGVRTGRPLYQRITNYTVLVVLGPLLLSVSLSAAVNLPRLPWVSTVLTYLPLSGKLFSVPPFLFTWTIFSLAYRMLPNTSVRLKSAVVGGIMAGSVWEFAKLLNIWTAKSLFFYGAVYGSLATLPIFLLWIYITWLIFLMGARFAYADQNLKEFELDAGGERISERARAFAGLRFMLEVCRDFSQGRPARPLKTLAAHVHIPERVLGDVAEALVERNLLVSFVTEAGPAYVPARAVDKIFLMDVLVGLQTWGGVSFSPVADAETKCVQRLQENLEETMARVQENVDFQQVIRELDVARDFHNDDA